MFGANDSVDDRETPDDLFAALHDQYDFTVDVAAAPHNFKCARYFTRAVDGLSQSWAGERVWCNPPFSDIAPWIRKAWAEFEGGGTSVVMLLPANRTDQVWWHELVEPYRDRAGSPLTTRFLKGRPRFMDAARSLPGRPPFGCVVLVWQAVSND